jgi:hypothetical protein
MDIQFDFVLNFEFNIDSWNSREGEEMLKLIYSGLGHKGPISTSSCPDRWQFLN